MNHKMLRIHLLSVLFLTLTVNADPTQLKRVPATLTIYVPVRNIRLERRQVQGQLYNFMATANSTYASVVAQNALPLLFRNARRSFPKGTKLMKFPETKWNGKGEVMYVSLSKQFVQPSFWKGERQTKLAVYAIVNTATEGYASGDTIAVKLLVDGKPLRNLATLDLRKPLRPNFDLVTKQKKS